MLKTRIIGVVLIKAGIVVQSIGFRRYLPIGAPEIAIDYLNRWGVDEIVVLHLDATEMNTSPSVAQIKSYADHCQVPLSVGGGIQGLNDIQRIIRAGADKVVINASLLSHPEIISEGAELFGEQSIVVSIDGRRQLSQDFMAFTSSGRKSTGLSVQDLAMRAEKLGAGEILITSIDQDGSKQGYDLDLIRLLVETVSVPVIACGGAGHPLHVQKAMHAGASAVAIGNLFHFTEHSVTVIKQYLKALSEPVRLDHYFTYSGFHFDQNGRIAKQEDAKLDGLRFHYIPEEAI